jgi:DNA transformation protein
MARSRRLRPLRVSKEFRSFVLDQLGGVPQLRARAMFGGVGLYSGETFFGIVAADELFLRTDDSTRGAYEAAGSEPFRPYEDRPITMTYWRVPLGVLEDATDLVAWAKAAVRVAANAPAKRRRSRPR